MAAYVHKPGTGSLFLNEEKQSETSPDVRGKAVLSGGEVMSVSGWWRTPQDKPEAQPYLHIKITPYQEREAQS